MKLFNEIEIKLNVITSFYDIDELEFAIKNSTMEHFALHTKISCHRMMSEVKSCGIHHRLKLKA
jgi:hypothetical protein